MSVEQNLQAIMNARYGRDVRQSIHDAISEINDVAINAEGVADTSRESARAYVQSARDIEQQTQALRNEAEQFKNDAFSTTPEGYEVVAGKVNSVVEVTGTDFVLRNSAEGGAIAHKIYGMSVQDGAPTPTNPADIKDAKANFKCVGKNLLEFPLADGYRPIQSYTSNGITYSIDKEGIITLNGTATSESAINLVNVYSASTAGKLKLGEQYTLSLNVLEGDIDTGSNKSVFIGVVRFDKSTDEYNYSVTTLSADPKVWTQSDENTLRYGVRLVIRNGRTVNNVKVRPILTLADNTDYLKYKHIDVTTNLTLRAIECTSSDKYNLVEGGKYYIADTLEWNEDTGYTVTRRVATEIFDGSTDEVISKWNDGNAYRNFAILLNQVPIFRNQSAGTVEKWQALVNRLQPTESVETNVFGRYAIQRVRDVEQYRLLIYDAGETQQFANITECRAWLGDNNIVVNYALAEPYTETITAHEAQELLKLKTYDDATSITATGDVAPVMDIEYATSRYTALAFTAHNKAHESVLKIAEINTAILELTSL